MKSAKRKGMRWERELQAMLSKVPGIHVRRQPGSGIYSDFPHDLCLQCGNCEWVVEAKHWEHGWRTGDKALGQADFLIIKRDYHGAAVYMPLDVFLGLMEEIAMRMGEDRENE